MPFATDVRGERAGTIGKSTLLEYLSSMVRSFAFRTRLRLARDTLQFFYIQRVRGFDSPTSPHLEPNVTDWLERRLQTTKLFLEFGSGGSTVLANRLGVPSITVESDRFYAKAVQKVITNGDLTTMVIPKMGITKAWGMPVFFRRKKGFRYVRAAFDRLGGAFPDFILVDGRYRVACALETARRAYLARSTAQLMLDDYEGRVRYHVLEKYFGSPHRIGRAAVFHIGGIPIPESAVQTFISDAQ